MRISFPRVAPLLLALAFLAGCGKPAQRPASFLTPKDREVLAAYEKIRAALASDDLMTAKRTAGKLADAVKPGSPSDKPSDFLAPAKALADCMALDQARDIFRALSRPAIALAGNVAGFYVLTSPLAAQSHWLQTTPEVDNPYFGKAMHSMGDLKK